MSGVEHVGQHMRKAVPHYQDMARYSLTILDLAFDLASIWSFQSEDAMTAAAHAPMAWTTPAPTIYMKLKNTRREHK